MFSIRNNTLADVSTLQISGDLSNVFVDVLDTTGKSRPGRDVEEGGESGGGGNAVQEGGDGNLVRSFFAK